MPIYIQWQHVTLQQILENVCYKTCEIPETQNISLKYNDIALYHNSTIKHVSTDFAEQLALKL